MVMSIDGSRQVHFCRAWTGAAGDPGASASTMSILEALGIVVVFGHDPVESTVPMC
jgi:hypothetical protein